MYYSKAILTGRIADDLEVKSTNKGTSVVNMTVAVNYNDDVDFWDVVVFGQQAEHCSSYLGKGDIVLVDGRLTKDSWEDSDGNTRTKAEIVASNVVFGPNRNEVDEVDEFVEENQVVNQGEGNEDEEIDPEEISF